MRKLTIAFLCIFALASCGKDIVYDEFTRNFDQNRWAKSDVKSFEFTLKDSTASYDLDVEFSHVAGFQFGNIPVQIELTSPDSQVIVEHMIIQIKDATGRDRGDCTGDYCDLSQMAFTGRQMVAGKYKIRISNEFDNAYLPNVIGLGITLKYSKVKPE